tara:strand:+ start:824 stop:1501 length:678 start_codon:yes stop_codon:yes gene_type:complete
MAFGTSNKTVLGAVQAQNDQQFKSMNNLLSLQENHVEEFFQYHGEQFLTTLEKLMEDVTERVVSNILTNLEFVQDSTTGTLKLSGDCKTALNTITQENINNDMTNILNAAINTEVIAQRKMAKQQYLESQGFNSPQATGMQQQQPQQGYQQGMTNQPIQQGAYGATGLAMNNGSGYPIPPTGNDNYGRPYWIDPQNGQMSYEPPQSGLHLAQKAQKLAAWGKWLM